MIAVRYHDKVKPLETIGHAASGPFDRVQWYELLASFTSDPLLIALAGHADAMTAFPLVKRNNRLEALVNWYNFTWRPVSVAGQAEHAEPVAHGLRDHSARVTLWPLPDEDGTASHLETAFRNAGWWVSREKCDDNHVLPVRGRSYAQYLAGRPGPLRTTLKRKISKVEVEIHDFYHDDTWGIYERIYKKSWKPAEGEPDLLRAFARAEGAAGRIRFGLAFHEGQPVAAQFWTVEAGTAWIHKLAHLEDAQALSPGTSLTAALMEHVIDRDGVNLVDFGTGNDPYKRDWMEENRPRFRLDCFNPSRLNSWPYIARQLLHRLRPGASVASGPS